MNQESGITNHEAEEADPGTPQRRILRVSLALASVLIWTACILKTGDPHPRTLAAIVCGTYTLVAFFGLRKIDMVFFPLAALLTGLSYWRSGELGVVLGIAGALTGIGGMSGGVLYVLVTMILSSLSC